MAAAAAARRWSSICWINRSVASRSAAATSVWSTTPPLPECKEGPGGGIYLPHTRGEKETVGEGGGDATA